jgi:hypothetical protein
MYTEWHLLREFSQLYPHDREPLRSFAQADGAETDLLYAWSLLLDNPRWRA